MESINCPLTPKSHSLISPWEFIRMLDGFTSVSGKEPEFSTIEEAEQTPRLLR